MREGTKIWRVTDRAGGPVGYMVTAGRSGRPLAWVNWVCPKSLAKAQDIARSPERIAEFADYRPGRTRLDQTEWLLSFSVKDLRGARTLTRGIWRNVLCNAVLWPVARNGRRIGNGYFGCAQYTDRRTVDGKPGLAMALMVRHADTISVDRRSGIAVCNYVPGVGRIQDTEASKGTAAVESENKRRTGQGKMCAA